MQIFLKRFGQRKSDRSCAFSDGRSGLIVGLVYMMCSPPITVSQLYLANCIHVSDRQLHQYSDFSLSAALWHGMAPHLGSSGPLVLIYWKYT